MFQCEEILEASLKAKKALLDFSPFFVFLLKCCKPILFERPQEITSQCVFKSLLLEKMNYNIKLRPSNEQAVENYKLNMKVY